MEKDHHQDQALALHNEARKSAPGPSRPPLIWSPTLSLAALTYAQHLAKTNVLKHDPSLHNQGENIYWSSSTTSPSSTLMAACTAWIEEISDYKGEVISPELMSKNVGHYTQVVWPGTRKVGMAKAKGKKGTYIVARYEPAGNVRGESAWGGAGQNVDAGARANDRVSPHGATAIARMKLAASAAIGSAIRGNYTERGRRRG